MTLRAERSLNQLGRALINIQSMTAYRREYSQKTSFDDEMCLLNLASTPLEGGTWGTGQQR